MSKQLELLKSRGYLQTDCREHDQVYYFTKDKITLWVKLVDTDFVIKDLWYDSGMRGCTLFDGRLVTEDILSEIEEFENKKICSDCGKEVKEYAGQHLAGSYCNDCWVVYKGLHSGICSLCNSPYYDCHC